MRYCGLSDSSASIIAAVFGRVRSNSNAVSATSSNTGVRWPRRSAQCTCGSASGARNNAVRASHDRTADAVNTASADDACNIHDEEDAERRHLPHEHQRLEQQHEERAVQPRHLALVGDAKEVVKVGGRTVQKAVQRLGQKRRQQRDLDADRRKTTHTA